VAHGHLVVSLDRRPPSDGYKPAWSVDLRQPGALFEACEGADAVVHLAAHIAPGLASDCDTFNDNVALTYNVLKAAAVQKVRRAVIASSIGAYGYLYGRAGEAPLYLPIDEDHPCRPTDPYGLSKLVGETACEAFADAGAMSIASLRLPGVNYDPSFRRIEGFMKDPAYRKPGFWTYIDARDAAAAFRLSLEAEFIGHRIFNVAAPTSNMREPTPELIRRFFPSLRDIRRADSSNWSGMSSARAERELGFRACFVWENELGRPAAV
jgi:nucleoside-diphosphate-sugar epimerase